MRIRKEFAKVEVSKGSKERYSKPEQFDSRKPRS